MKHFAYLLITISLLICSCNTTTNKVNTEKDCGVAQITTTKIDLGQLQYGEIVGVKYKLQNIGNAPLTIAEIKTTCGCTKAIYPKQPINKDETATIELIFDTSGLNGYQYKTATVVTQSCKTQEIKIAFTAEIN